jgi:hypothetical protein
MELSSGGEQNQLNFTFFEGFFYISISFVLVFWVVFSGSN